MEREKHWLVEANFGGGLKMSHRAAKGIQAHVRHVLATAKMKKSKGLSKHHTMMPQKEGGGEQIVTSNAKHEL